mgnify:CR=1 FL=1
MFTRNRSRPGGDRVVARRVRFRRICDQEWKNDFKYLNRLKQSASAID